MADQNKIKKKHKASRIPVEYYPPDHLPEFERRRIFTDDFLVNQSVFKKTPEEKLRLKIVKANCKEANKKGI